MIRLTREACALALALAASLTPSTRALADPVREVFTPQDAVQIQQTRVSVTAADLADDASRQALVGRLDGAAAAVCQARPPVGPDPALTYEQIVCRRRALAESAYRLHDARLWSMAVERVRAIGPGW